MPYEVSLDHQAHRASRNPNVHWTMLDGEAVLVNLENGHYYTLNRVGATIWELLSGGRTFDEVLSEICTRYEVSECSAREDLAGFMNLLGNEQLVEGESTHVRESETEPAG